MDESGLTPRQLDVLVGIAIGETELETAARLCLGEQTIKYHRTNLFRALGAHRAGHAVAIAYERGILGQKSRGDEKLVTFSVAIPESAAKILRSELWDQL